MAINEQALSTAYAAYDSDPRVSGPDDYDAYRVGIEAYLAAADAAAAPAVGVTVDEAMVDRAMDGWLSFTDHYTALLQPGERLFWPTKRVIRTMLEAALLTAQPEPGTHDDAGQPAEGGVAG